MDEKYQPLKENKQTVYYIGILDPEHPKIFNLLEEATTSESAIKLSEKIKDMYPADKVLILKRVEFIMEFAEIDFMKEYARGEK